MFGGGGGTPEPTAAQVQLENEQRQTSAKLDKQENERRKRLLAAAQGIRAFRGSAILRAAPGNRAGGRGTSILDGGSIGGMPVETPISVMKS
jgi:hypothetical protein